MTQQTERRKAERRTDDEELSPEYLELLEICGGEIRARDRAILAGRRKDGPEAAAAPGGPADAPTVAGSGQRQADGDGPDSAAAAADRRAHSR